MKNKNPSRLVWRRDRYLHNCHTDTDSQNNSTVVKEPFFHTGYTALEERTREREGLRKTWKEGGCRPTCRAKMNGYVIPAGHEQSLFKTQLLALD